MIDKNIFTLLMRHDCPVNAEKPENFNIFMKSKKWDILVTIVNRCGASILSQNNFDQIEDASFFGELEFSINNQILFLRYSNFDEFFTLYDKNLKSHSIAQLIIRELANEGFRYIPIEALMLKYNGKNNGVDGIETWYHRYFDYI